MQAHSNMSVMVSGRTDDIVENDIVPAFQPSSDDDDKDLMRDMDIEGYVDKEIRNLGVQDYPMPLDERDILEPNEVYILNATNMTLSQVYHEMNTLSFGGKLPKISACYISPLFHKNFITKRIDGTVTLSMMKKDTSVSQLKQLFAVMSQIYCLELGQTKQ